MGKEHHIGCNDEFELRLEAKDPRLPKHLRTYIRRLKQSGKIDEAVKRREHFIHQRRNKAEIAVDELHKTIAEVICTDDPVEEAAGNIRITWLMSAVGLIETPEERKAQILEIFDAAPKHVQEALEPMLPAIRYEVQPLMPTAA